MDYFGLKSLAELPDIQAMEDELEEDGPVDLFMIVTNKKETHNGTFAKVIAHAGITSRRKAEELIVAGRVSVNGQIVKELGVQVSAKDRVEVDGVPIEQESPVYYMLYKPRGVISAVTDDKKESCFRLFTDVPERLYPIGRLDYDTSGLLLLTNDGDLSQKLMHPKHEVDKVYVAKVKGIADKNNYCPCLEEFGSKARKPHLLALRFCRQTLLLKQVSSN